MRSDSSRPKHILASPVWRSADVIPPTPLPNIPAVPPNTPPNTPPPPPNTPPSASCPSGNCPTGTPVLCLPGQGRNSAGTCGTCARPSVRVGDQCCSPKDLAPGGRCVKNNPGCAAGETPVGPSNACCPVGRFTAAATALRRAVFPATLPTVNACRRHRQTRTVRQDQPVRNAAAKATCLRGNRAALPDR